MKVGLGLWTMRSTASHPAPWPCLYEQLRTDARLTESLGFHSLWVAEHHFWYDGWTPAPLVAAASALGATSRLHVGTGIHLLPMYDTDRIVSQLRFLHRFSGGRFEHGVGLGYRASEYDGYGLSRRLRARRMDLALEKLAATDNGMPSIWVGGFASSAVQRAGRLGLGLLLPSTLKRAQLLSAIDEARSAASSAGRSIRIGIMKYAWLTDGSRRHRDWAVEMLGRFTREYSGSWFALKGRPGFESPELLEAQMSRSAETALIGSAEEIASELQELSALGVELCVLHLVGDGRLPERHHVMARLADEVLPTLTVAVPA